jgi:hypothetical protein
MEWAAMRDQRRFKRPVAPTAPATFLSDLPPGEGEDRARRRPSQAPWVRVQQPSAHHLYWPDLDVDLAVESIEHPERFPLVSKVRSNSRLQRTPARGRR